MNLRKTTHIPTDTRNYQSHNLAELATTHMKSYPGSGKPGTVSKLVTECSGLIARNLENYGITPINTSGKTFRIREEEKNTAITALQAMSLIRDDSGIYRIDITQ